MKIPIFLSFLFIIANAGKRFDKSPIISIPVYIKSIESPSISSINLYRMTNTALAIIHINSSWLEIIDSLLSVGCIGDPQ